MALIIVSAILMKIVFVICQLYRHRQEPFESAFEALSNLGDGVEVRSTSHGMLFLPLQDPPTLGLVYLPGALVNARAYAPLCRDMAKQSGCAVLLLDVPMRMAIFGFSRIRKDISEVQEVFRWVIGGHSLGGAAAAKFIMSNAPADDVSDASSNDKTTKLLNPEPKIVGLLLHAAYVTGAVTQSNTMAGRGDISVLQVLAENDGVINQKNLATSKTALPDTGASITISGGNHAGFGHYGPQTYPSADGECVIGLAEQQRQVARVTAKWMRSVDCGMESALTPKGSACGSPLSRIRRSSTPTMWKDVSDFSGLLGEN